MAKVIVSQINPVQFVNEDKTNLSKYFSHFMDEYIHWNRLNEWQSSSLLPFKQVWTDQDTLKLQIITDAGLPTLHVVSKCGLVQSSTAFTQVLQNVDEPTFWLYEISFAMSGVTVTVPDDLFFLRITSGALRLISEPLYLASDPTHTLLIEYKHRSFYQNMVFEEGFYSSLRVNAMLRFKQAAAKDTLYEDQVLDMVMLKSKPFRIFEFIVGVKTGTPDFLIDKVNRIFGCSDLLIDGKYFAKNDGAKWEESDSIANNALKTYIIELRESTNKDSGVFDTVPEQSGGIFTPEFVFEFM